MGHGGCSYEFLVGCDARFSKKPGPISDQKMSFPHPFSDLEEVTERNIHVYIDRNYNIITQIRAPTNSHIMGLFPINLEPIEKYVYTPPQLPENHTRFQTKMGKVYTSFQTKTAQKPYSLGRHTPIWLIEGSFPPPPHPGCLVPRIFL